MDISSSSIIKTIEAYVQKKDGCISLSQGSLKIDGIPQEIKTYLQEILLSDKADYYSSEHLSHLLKTKIASSLNRRYHATLTPEHIAITHGCIGGISSALLTILEPGDEVILPDPTYPVYQGTIALAKGIPQFVSCDQQSEMTSHPVWQLDITRIQKATTPRTKAILFSNPCNPTGQIVPKDILEELITWCEKKGIYLIVDEVYEDYIFDGTFTSVTPYILESSHIIRASSFSKSFAMSGWRIGYVALPTKLRAALEDVQHALLICPSVLGQWAGVYAIDHPELTKRFFTTIETNRTLTQQKLQPLLAKKLFSYQKPQASFFFFLQTNQSNTEELCRHMIDHAGVSLIPGPAFGPRSNQCIRLCIARNTDVLAEGLDRFISYWNRFHVF